MFKIMNSMHWMETPDIVKPIINQNNVDRWIIEYFPNKRKKKYTVIFNDNTPNFIHIETDVDYLLKQ